MNVTVTSNRPSMERPTPGHRVVCIASLDILRPVMPGTRLFSVRELRTGAGCEYHVSRGPTQRYRSFLA
ncbi:hypothetical protein FIBSPDRAFT_873053 [Athelia psychrophila]|uniref:Uncharacterized protein n=1 Tax=Athelia psychrophila TaxID=1759441 RepID=A0A165YXJ7_9AGAM|nr:hypothetical protein FIBSPDRAFT_873053 [Fibularhizoctonia sp. CBS 109695]